MDRLTIADSVRLLENFLQVLDNAYWEAAEIGHKDVIYDLISTLHGELNELAKLSVEDHYMAYEPVTHAFRNCHAKLKLLQNSVDVWINRSSTARLIDEELPGIIGLLNNLS